MESKQDIGKAFREKLDQLHMQPGDAVWNSIKSDLNKKKRSAIPVWLRLWTIVGVFVLTAFFTYPLWKNYVPHIYIKMPEQETEQVTVKTSEESNSINPGKEAAAANNSNIKNNSTADINEAGNSATNTANPETQVVSPSASTQEAIVAAESRPKSDVYNKPLLKSRNNSGISITSKAQDNAFTDAPATSTGISPTTPRSTDKNNSVNRKTDRVTTKNAQNKNESPASHKNNDIARGETRNNNKNTSADNEIDEGFIVPMSAAYKSYRNNTSRGIPADTIAKDTTQADDFAKVTDSLRKVHSTGVQDVLKAPETKIESESGKSFYLYGFVAPTKYTFAENAGYIDAGLQDKNTSAEISLAYAAYVGYNITPKLSVRIGAIKSKVGLIADNILVPTGDFTGIEYEEGISNSTITARLNNSGNDDIPSAVVNIRNNFEFIEVPLELTYRINEGKIGLGVLGGFITRFTTDNTVFAANEAGSLQIGKIKSLKEVNNGISLGGSFNYNILPNLQLNVEPVYRYFFSSDQFIKQHTYSIQAGLQFNFGLGKQQ